MTDRINSFTVVLDRNYRDDEVEHLLNAIRMIKGVVDVVPNVADFNEVVAEMRTKQEMKKPFLSYWKNLHNDKQEVLFDRVRLHLFDGRLSARQVAGMTAILNEWDSFYLRKDDRHLAYALATTHHETDRTMWPIEEYGKGKGCHYGTPCATTGNIFYGRGFVQLTWESNYLRAGRELKVDLVGLPHLALELDIATKIMFLGMTKGWFTSRKLSDYFAPGKEDWENARRIINGKDKAKLIAHYGREYYSAISHTI